MTTYIAVYNGLFGQKRVAGMTNAATESEAVEHFENQREDDPGDRALQEWHNNGQKVEVENVD